MSQIQKIADDFISTKSEKSFKKLINRLSPGILKKISIFETDPDKKKEIANIVFAKAWTKIDQYSPDRGAFSTWIYKIVHNECLLEKRHTNRIKSLDKMVEDGTLKQPQALFNEDFNNIDNKTDIDVIDILYKKTIDVIYKLNTKDREGDIRSALIKWHIEKKPYHQIAKEMNIPENTAKNKVFKGKKLIKSKLFEKESELINLYKTFVSENTTF